MSAQSPDYSSYLVQTPDVTGGPRQFLPERQSSRSSSASSSASSHPLQQSSLHPNSRSDSSAQQQQTNYYDPSSYGQYSPNTSPSSARASSGRQQQQQQQQGYAPPSSSSSSTQQMAFSGVGNEGRVPSYSGTVDEFSDGFAGGDLQFQLPSFLGPSSHAAPGGGVETFPNRSVGDWNNPSFNAGAGEVGGAVSWDAMSNWNDSTLNFNSPPIKSQPALTAPNFANVPTPAEVIHRANNPTSPDPSTVAISPSSLTNLHLPAQPTEQVAFPTGSHLLPSAPTMATIPQVGKNMPGLYSTTGFDVLGVLSRVVGRANPRTVLGPVDFSCSFLVVDVRKFDCPIVYASPTFSNLTGYEGKEIVGKNCRFLQSPDGEVTKGSRRRYTDNVAVSHLQRQLSQGKECQASLINYRKGGVPFINLVTVVPIPWDGDDIVFHVGFQVDLVESPNAILRNIRDGTYQVNYQSLNNPQLPLAPAGQLEYGSSGFKGKSGLSGELLDVLGPKVHELAGEEALQNEWYKTVFDQSDDFIHVLSLKGQFLYVSPSVRRVLEYEPEDLANKNITEICHPSDHVPLMRALKDSTLKEGPDGNTVPIVNFLFRVRRKTSGMVWIECTGRLHVEPGKGRKAVILCGREKVVPKLEWAAVAGLGGVEEKDLWCSVSFDGLILSASESTTDAFGQPKDEIVGSSLLEYVPPTEATNPPVVSNSPDIPTTLIEPPHARLQTAIRSASHGLPKKSGTPVRHFLVTPPSADRPAMVHDVVSVFYSVDNNVPQTSHWDPHGNRMRSPSPWGTEQQSGQISPAASDVTDSFSVDGGAGPSKRTVRATSVLCQIKILSSTPKTSSPPVWTASSPSSSTSAPQPLSTGPARPLTRPAGSDVFEDIDTTRLTGWQYELHQLKNDNRKLRLKVAEAREAGPSRRSAGANESGRGKSVNPAIKRKRDSNPASSATTPTPASYATASTSATSSAGAPGWPTWESSRSAQQQQAGPSNTMPTAQQQALASYPYQQPPRPQQQQPQNLGQYFPAQQQQQQGYAPQQQQQQGYSFGGQQPPLPPQQPQPVPTYEQYTTWMQQQQMNQGQGQSRS